MSICSSNSFLLLPGSSVTSSEPVNPTLPILFCCYIEATLDIYDIILLASNSFLLLQRATYIMDLVKRIAASNSFLLLLGLTLGHLQDLRRVVFQFFSVVTRAGRIPNSDEVFLRDRLPILFCCYV